MAPTGWPLVLPILIPLLAATLAFALRKNVVAQRAVALLGLAAMLFAGVRLLLLVIDGGPQAVAISTWPAPFGIVLVADLLSALLVVVAAFTGLVVSLYAGAEIGPARERHGFHQFLLILLAGSAGAFLTGDIFNLYVWYEILLMSTFGLMVLGGEKMQVDGGVKYMALNLVSTIILLTAIGLLYGMTGTLNMADLHLKIPQVEDQGMLTVVAVMFIIAFAIKAGLFPVFAWLPASYHTPPMVVGALFAALLTKIGVYSLIRVFTLIFTHDMAITHTVLAVLAAITMIAGVLGAAAQTDVRRLLTFSVVSQIGFMLIGLALMNRIGLVGTVFYMLQDILVKAALFLGAGIAVRYAAGQSAYGKLGGLWLDKLWLALLVLVPSMALVGFPPLSGFWGKLGLVRGALEAEAWVLVGIALATSLVTVYAVGRMFATLFWKPAPALTEAEVRARAAAAPGRADMAMMVPAVVALALAVIGLGVFAEPVLALVDEAARQLLDPTAYVIAVLGPDAVPAPVPTLMGGVR
ncbi:proton-conducting transporter membrane subunit [Novispirillum sp. DQ9]|uniref:proton-conducting transporter transmembrane domain-containing protein n=1 Tax=Novispirillum sp. DQ9 TaxID=3398612 RepID=UPI003C7C390B